VALDQQWQADRLTAALRRLTEEQQQVLAMRFGQGLSVQATAEQLGKSVGAVKMLQARAVAMLTELMSN
jgi:RNA polymerase sigma-70 factor (ECF subfamily)